MNIYKLTTYKNDNNSLSGISESHLFYFTTIEGAEFFANANWLNIVEYCREPNAEATIEKIIVRDVQIDPI